MFADLDHSHPEVRKDIFDWGTWIISTLGLGGMRLDAIKHYSLSFLADLISHLDLQHKDLFFVGEYWQADSKALQKVLRVFNGRIKLFDVQLVYSLSDYSKGLKTDLRNVFEGSLSELDPHHAVVSVLIWPLRLPALLIFSDLCCKSRHAGVPIAGCAGRGVVCPAGILSDSSQARFWHSLYLLGGCIRHSWSKTSTASLRW